MSSFGTHAFRPLRKGAFDLDKDQIALWSGSIESIPSGWILCDGNNGTPDLMNVFVIGAGGGFAVDDTGGSTLHTHSFTGDGHLHSIINHAPFTLATAGAQPLFSVEQASGTTNSANAISPFLGLAFIQAIS